MTIEIAPEECECPVPKLIGWAKSTLANALTTFNDAAPEGYHLWSGPYQGTIVRNESGRVTVHKMDTGVLLIAEYKKHDS